MFEATAAPTEMPQGEDIPAREPVATPTPYIRRREVVEYAPQHAAAVTTPTLRANRGLVTDYGYIVSELQRTGLTFGGLIVLLIVIARLLH